MDEFIQCRLMDEFHSFKFNLFKSNQLATLNIWHTSKYKNKNENSYVFSVQLGGKQLRTLHICIFRFRKWCCGTNGFNHIVVCWIVTWMSLLPIEWAEWAHRIAENATHRRPNMMRFIQLVPYYDHVINYASMIFNDHIGNVNDHWTQSIYLYSLSHTVEIGVYNSTKKSIRRSVEIGEAQNVFFSTKVFVVCICEVALSANRPQCYNWKSIQFDNNSKAICK